MKRFLVYLMILFISYHECYDYNSSKENDHFHDRRLSNSKSHKIPRKIYSVKNPTVKLLPTYVSDNDNININYWADPKCSKKMITGGDGWCVTKREWFAIVNYKKQIQANMDYILFQNNCCKFLMVFTIIYYLSLLHFFYFLF